MAITTKTKAMPMPIRRTMPLVASNRIRPIRPQSTPSRPMTSVLLVMRLPNAPNTFNNHSFSCNLPAFARCPYQGVALVRLIGRFRTEIFHE
jgi:hypothetical protein